MTRKSPELDVILDECLNLLTVYYTYQKLIGKFRLYSNSRLELLQWWVQIRVFENDIIMRICRLDDDGKNNHSLREALRSLRNKIPQNEVQVIDKRLKEYRKTINVLKTKSRNYYLAHMSKSGNCKNSDPKGNFEKPIEMVVTIIDEISKDNVKYLLKVGSKELPIDLRVELSKN